MRLHYYFNHIVVPKLILQDESFVNHLLRLSDQEFQKELVSIWNKVKLSDDLAENEIALEEDDFTPFFIKFNEIEHLIMIQTPIATKETDVMIAAIYFSTTQTRYFTLEKSSKEPIIGEWTYLKKSNNMKHINYGILTDMNQFHNKIKEITEGKQKAQASFTPGNKNPVGEEK